MARGDHVRLQQGPFQTDMVVTQSFVDSIQDLLSDILTTLQIMFSIREDLWLHDGDNAILLANANILGQHIGILHDGKWGRCIIPSLQYTMLLGKVSSILLILGTALTQPIQTLGFAIGPCQRHYTFVHLDAHNATLILYDFGEGITIISFLVECLMEKDNTSNTGVHSIICCQKQLPIEAPIFLCILTSNGLQSLCNATSGLICCQDSLSWSNNLVSLYQTVLSFVLVSMLGIGEACFPWLCW